MVSLDQAHSRYFYYSSRVVSDKWANLSKTLQPGMINDDQHTQFSWNYSKKERTRVKNVLQIHRSKAAIGPINWKSPC